MHCMASIAQEEARQKLVVHLTTSSLHKWMSPGVARHIANQAKIDEVFCEIEDADALE